VTVEYVGFFGTNGDAWPRWTTAFLGGAGTVDIQSNRGRLQTAATGAYLDNAGAFYARVLDGKEVHVRVTPRQTWATEAYFAATLTTELGGLDGYDLVFLGAANQISVQTIDLVTTLATISYVFTGSTAVHFKFRRLGARLDVKAWDDGTAEPAVWNTHSDTSQGSPLFLAFSCNNGLAGTSVGFEIDQLAIDDLTSSAAVVAALDAGSATYSPPSTSLAYVGSTITLDDTAADLTDDVAFDAPAVAGDLLLVGYSYAFTITTPSGWTALPVATAGNAQGYVFWKIAVGGETTQAFTLSATDGQRAAVFIRIEGAHDVNPIAAYGIAASPDESGGSTTPIGAVTPTSVDQMVVYFQMSKHITSGPVTPPTGYTEVQDGIYVYGYQQASGGYRVPIEATTLQSLTWTLSAISSWHTFVLAINPATVTPGQPMIARRSFLPHGSTANSTFRRGF
jgi:hypothetical protein